MPVLYLNIFTDSPTGHANVTIQDNDGNMHTLGFQFIDHWEFSARSNLGKHSGDTEKGTFERSGISVGIYIDDQTYNAALDRMTYLGSLDESYWLSDNNCVNRIYSEFLIPLGFRDVVLLFDETALARAPVGSTLKYYFDLEAKNSQSVIDDARENYFHWTQETVIEEPEGQSLEVDPFENLPPALAAELADALRGSKGSPISRPVASGK